MAVALESFSIRQYASKMRSVDVEKSWPFGVDTKEEMSAKLPPIKCPKYRWWKDELKKAVRSNFGKKKMILEETEKAVTGERSRFVSEDEENMVMSCPVCRSFTAMTVNAHIDSCLAQTKLEPQQRRLLQMSKKSTAAETVVTKKEKSRRSRKKRSIIDIFAASPQIEAVDSDNRSTSEEVFDLEVLRKRSDVVVDGYQKKKTTMLKKKNKIDGGFVAPSSRTVKGTNKEKFLKFKVPSAVDFCGQQKVSLHDKSSRKEIPDASAFHKKKTSRMKSMRTQKKLKVVRASKFLAKQESQEPFPGHSILKSCAEVTSSQNKSAISSLQGDDQTNACHVEQSDKYVRLSSHDEIFGPTKIQYSSAEVPQVQSLSKELSDVVDASPVWDSMENDTDFPAVEVTVDMNGSHVDVSTGIANEISGQSEYENSCLDDFHSHVSILAIPSPDKSYQDKEETYADRSVDLNPASNDDLLLFRRGNSNESQTLSYASFPRPESTPKEGFEPNSETHADGSGVQRKPNRGRSFAEPAAMTSLENANESLQPSTSCLDSSAETNGRYQFQSHASQEKSSGCDFLHQSLRQMSSKELMTSICSSVEWRKQRESVYSEKGVLDNFIGLPLNSQGEFIQLCSGGKEGFNLVKPTEKMGSASDFRLLDPVQPNNSVGFPNMIDKNNAEAALPNEKFKVFPWQNQQQENTELPLSYKLGISELHDTGRAEVYWQDLLRRNSYSIHQLASDKNITDLSLQTRNQTERENIQSEKNSDCMFAHTTRPTMRLMGKVVTVGINDTEVQGFEDGRTCADKGTVTGHRFTTTVSDNPPLKRQFRQECIALPFSGKPKETTTTSLEAQSKPSLVSTFPTKTADPRFVHPYLNWQTYVRQQNILPLIRANAGAKPHSFLHPLPSQTLLNKRSNCEHPSSNPATESQKMTSTLPVAESASSSNSQHMLLNYSQPNCNQRLPHGIKSPFHFPLPNQKCRANAQPSWSQSSSQRLPQWLLNEKQQKEAPLTSSHPYSSANADHSCTISGTNFSGATKYSTSMVAHPHHAAFHPHKQRPTGPTPFFHPPLIPALRGSKPTSVINASYRNKIEDKDGEKSNPDSVKIAKKRPADQAADDSAKAMKKPNLEMQGDPSAVEELNKRINITGYTQCNTGAADFDVFRDKARNLGYSLPEIQTTGFRDPSNISGYAQCNAGAAEFDAFRDKSRDLGHSLQEIQKAGFRDSSCFNSFKQDGVIKAGPIKLIAGAKHILKPRQNMDRDQPRPTHSTIPFGAVTNADKISEFQKSAQIYRF